MSNIAHDLFLLMNQLSQLKNRQRIITVFIEAIDSLHSEFSIDFIEGDSPLDTEAIDICTAKRHFGKFKMKGSMQVVAPEFPSLFQNAVQMLAVILERLRQEKLLEDEKLALKEMVDEKTESLRKSEEEHRRLRNYLNNVIDSMPSVLVGVDTEGTVTQWNRQAELETGIKANAAAHRKLEEVFPLLALEMEKIHIAMRERQTQRDPKKPFQENDEIRYRDVTVYPLIGNGVDGAVIRIDDITRQVRLEEMMIQSEKMLSVGGLAAGMAHEINNPLAGMIQNALVLINRLTGDLPANLRAAAECNTNMTAIRAFMEKRHIIKMLKLIHQSGCRAANIVQNMLGFARKSNSKPEPNDLCQLLDMTVELAQNDYDLKKNFDFRQIQIIRQYEPQMPTVYCEASKIQQVFLNLLKNGAEAMSETKGKPGKQKKKTGKPRFVLRVSREQNMARVEIEDNGPGMDEATRKRIFEPFFTTKGVGIGTGLGLSVSYFIITENHGGTMSVESTPARGAKFIIRLPIGRRPHP